MRPISWWKTVVVEPVAWELAACWLTISITTRVMETSLRWLSLAALVTLFPFVFHLIKVNVETIDYGQLVGCSVKTMLVIQNPPIGKTVAVDCLVEFKFVH